jgi:hypothetical protein
MTAVHHLIPGTTLADVGNVSHHETSDAPCACKPTECFGQDKDGSPLRVMVHNSLDIAGSHQKDQAER